MEPPSTLDCSSDGSLKPPSEEDCRNADVSFQAHWGAGTCTAVAEVERKRERNRVAERRRGCGGMPASCGTAPILGVVDEEAGALFSF